MDPLLYAIGFYTLAGLAIAAGLVLVLAKNLLHSVLALAVVSLAIAGLMLTLGAEFLAIVLVLVYVGAVVVISAFALMLTGNLKTPSFPPSNELKGLALGVTLGLVVLIAGVVLVQPWNRETLPGTVSVQQLGTLLMTQYVLPFELVSVLLLAALIGAIVIARGKE